MASISTLPEYNVDEKLEELLSLTESELPSSSKLEDPSGAHASLALSGKIRPTQDPTVAIVGDSGVGKSSIINMPFDDPTDLKSTHGSSAAKVGYSDQRPNALVMVAGHSEKQQTRFPTALDINRESKEIPVVVLIGEAGVGKSSIVNMLSDWPEGHHGSDPGKQAKVRVRSTIVACTKAPRAYRKYAGSRPFYVYDTAGLNKPTTDDAAATPARVAKQISDLLAELAQGGGISFVFFVLAVGRFTLAQQNNYRFARLLCDPDVPFILVATKEDAHSEGGELWLEDAKPRFEKQDIRFADSIVITASPGQEGRSEDKYQKSIRSLRDFVKKHLDVDALSTYSIHSSSLPEQVFKHISVMVTKALHPMDFQRELTSLLMRAYSMRWRDADEIADDHKGLLATKCYQKKIT